MRRVTTGLAFAVLLLVLVARPGAPRVRSVGVDFVQFHAVGQAGQPDVYSPEARARLGRSLQERAAADPRSRLVLAARRRPVLETYSSPALYAVFGLAASGDYDADFARYQQASRGAFAAGVVMAGVAAGLPVAASALLAAALLVVSGPLASDENVGNVVRLQVGLLGAAALLAARRTPRALAALGFVLGAAAAFKPNVVLAAGTLVLARLARREPSRPLVGGLAAGVLVAVVAGSAWAGSPWAWWTWLQALAQMPPEIIRVDMGNWGVTSLLGSRLGRATAVLLVSLPVLAATGWLSLRARAGTDVALLALGTAAWLLASPLTWLQDYLLAVPAMAVGLAAGGHARPLAAAALVLTATPPMAVLARTTATTWCVVYAVVAALAFTSVAIVLRRGTEERA